MNYSQSHADVTRKAPRRRRLARFLSSALIVVGLCMFAAGAWLWFSEADSVREQEDIADAVATTDTDGDGEPDVDFEQARELVGCDAWIEIPDAGISLPVMQATADAPDYWLRHNQNGKWTWSGTLFIDSRTSADADNALVYGHHLTSIGGMFSNIFDTYQQDKFDAKLADGATWTTATGSHEMRTLCALRVHETNQLVQRFDFDDTTALHEWLRQLVADAGAVSSDADALIMSSTHVVETVCCSSLRSGQPWRCVTVFVY